MFKRPQLQLSVFEIMCMQLVYSGSSHPEKCTGSSYSHGRWGAYIRVFEAARQGSENLNFQGERCEFFSTSSWQVVVSKTFHVAENLVQVPYNLDKE